MFNFISLIYTFLEDYKKDPNKANPYMVLTLYDELIYRKGCSISNNLGLGLARVDIIGDLNKREAEVIYNLTSDYFVKEPLFNKVLQFNHKPNEFNYEEHIQQCLKYF